MFFDSIAVTTTTIVINLTISTTQKQLSRFTTTSQLLFYFDLDWLQLTADPQMFFDILVYSSKRDVSFTALFL